MTGNMISSQLSICNAMSKRKRLLRVPDSEHYTILDGTEEILRLIEDTVEVEYFIRPVINLKATNSYDSGVEIDVNEEQD